MALLMESLTLQHGKLEFVISFISFTEAGSICFSHATSGSMVRPEKIMPTRTVHEEIESKYILSENGETDEVLLAATQKKMHASIFEIVGMDKIKQKQRYFMRNQLHPL